VPHLFNKIRYRLQHWRCGDIIHGDKTAGHNLLERRQMTGLERHIPLTFNRLKIQSDAVQSIA
jgi:hypothetical protein